MEATTDTHDCAWRAKAEELNQCVEKFSHYIEELKARIEQLERMLFGKRSEKMPSVKKELKVKADPQKTQKIRAERRAARNELPEIRYEYHVKSEDKQCPKCGSCELKKVGEGKVSTLIEYVPARLERQVHVQESLACPCGEYMVVAEGPQRPVEGGHYGPRFMASVVTAKCVDSMPLYRLEKQLKRIGLGVSRSSLCNLFHQTAESLKPIYKHMLDKMPQFSLVLADETPLPVQAENKTHRGFLWSFINDDYILYRYSRNRSGVTPSEVLKDSKGTLLADAYSGYNHICTPKGRVRAGCWAHVRRKFFEAKENAREAEIVIAHIKALYQVEYEAANLDILGSADHHKLRQGRALPILDELHKYILEQGGLHPPKSPMGKAIGYAINNWEELTRFLENSQLPLDNNASERALRIVALGRKNYLFAGNDEAAENLAGLYSLVASCEMHDINPEHYLADVLIRVHTHPHQQINELLPHIWKKCFLK
jgi:transposase